MWVKQCHFYHPWLPGNGFYISPIRMVICLGMVNMALSYPHGSSFSDQSFMQQTWKKRVRRECVVAWSVAVVWDLHGFCLKNYTPVIKHGNRKSSIYIYIYMYIYIYGSRPKTHARLLVSEWHLQRWMCMFCCSGERPRKRGVRFAKGLIVLFINL